MYEAYFVHNEAVEHYTIPVVCFSPLFDKVPMKSVFLQECVKNNRCTVYDLMASHGDKHNLIKLTIINKDFERVIRHHIHKNNYLEGRYLN